MKNSDFVKDPQSNPTYRPLNQHRRTSLRLKRHLRTEALGHESLSRNCEIVDSTVRCSCGNILKKISDKYCNICLMDLKIMAKYPNLKLKMIRVHVADFTASCNTELRRQSRKNGTLISKGKKTLETKTYPKRHPKSVENKSRKAIREFGFSKSIKNPVVRKKNNAIKKSIEIRGTVMKHQTSMNKTKLSSHTSKKVTRKTYLHANLEREDAKVAVTRKRNANNAKKISSLENAKHHTNRRGKDIIKKSRRDKNRSETLLHVCSGCGVTCDSNVGKLMHEFHHENKEASVILQKCDESRFAQVFTDESGVPSSNVCLSLSPKVETEVGNKVSISIHNEFSTEQSEFSTRCKLGIESQFHSPELRECRTINVLEDSAESEVALLTSQVQQYSGLLLGTGCAVKSENRLINCRNNGNTWNEKCDRHTTDMRLISSCKSITEPSNSSNDGTSVVDLTIPLSVDEFASSRCESTSMDDRDVHSLPIISSSVNTCKDHLELLVDDESEEERMDTEAEKSMNFESSCTNSPLVVVGNGRNAVTLGNNSKEFEAAGKEPIQTDKTTGSDVMFQEVKDMNEIVEEAKLIISEETSSCSLVQKTCGNGTVRPDECTEEDLDISDTDSNRAICGDESGINFLNEGIPDQTENNKHTATLEQLDLPLQECERDVNLPSQNLHVSVSRDGEYYKISSDMTMPPSMEYRETFSKVEVQSPLTSSHSITGQSQDLDCPVGSTVSEDLESFPSWTESQMTATNQDVLHAVISHRSSTLESTSEDSEHSEISVDNSIAVKE